MSVSVRLIGTGRQASCALRWRKKNDCMYYCKHILVNNMYGSWGIYGIKYMCGTIWYLISSISVATSREGDRRSEPRSVFSFLLLLALPLPSFISMCVIYAKPFPFRYGNEENFRPRTRHTPPKIRKSKSSSRPKPLW